MAWANEWEVNNPDMEQHSDLLTKLAAIFFLFARRNMQAPATLRNSAPTTRGNSGVAARGTENAEGVNCGCQCQGDRAHPWSVNPGRNSEKAARYVHAARNSLLTKRSSSSSEATVSSPVSQRPCPLMTTIICITQSWKDK